ncbi:SAP domain-containing ribonucleoprotein [Malaya genurostris]|uniref:SAP domain-containing ribonucleoprotein n=1 Tax=Malaya genurostris TaxID=325434 RepID=UPI0026F398D4|nr:SAP domain-containing ribonucleoprotein [Malaya genurostris]
MSDNDISKMKVADLKKELKTRGLNTLGNKNELVERLQNALIDGGDPLEDTANSEDLLEDDELNDDILEEEEEKLQDVTVEEDRMLKSPTPSEASKSESPEQQKALDQCSKDHEPEQGKKEEQSLPHKKVALKRNISISVPTPVTTPAAVTSVAGDSNESKNKETVTKSSEQQSGEPEKKIIKLSQMTAQERLEMRAKKFGAQTTESSDSKLQARAARFGLGSAGSSTTSTNSLISLDALKRRAERFGGSVSNKVTKLELDEKLQKRQARFGEAATASKLTATGKVAITATSSTTTDYSERARLRLERFKNVA